MLFKKIIQPYIDYISLDYYKKLRAGELLGESARLLLQIDKKELENESALQRNYLMRKIAGDLLRQVQDMAHTKQYDCAPELREYTYLALYLAYDYCEFKPDRRLLPFLSHVIYYEKYNDSKKYLIELEDIYNKSLILEREYSKNLIDPDNSVFTGDIWGF